MKSYIIGSLSQAEKIKSIAKEIYYGEVKYVKPEPKKSFEECVKNCFDNIEWTDNIYVILKPNKTLGQGLTYEVEYAKRLKKNIIYC